MSPARSLSKSNLDQVEKLTEAATSLEHQVRTLGLILDEIREDLIGAVRNDRLRPASFRQEGTAVPASSTTTSFEEEALERERRACSPPPAQPTPSAASSSRPRSSVPVNPSESIKANKKHLKDQMYANPLYIEIMTIVGYEGIALADFHEKGKQLIGTHGRDAAEEAAEAVTRIDTSSEPAMLYLNDQARPFAWPTLGPDPKNPPWWSKIMAERQEEVLSEKKKRSRKESVAKDVKK